MLRLSELAYAPRGLGPLSLELGAGQVIWLCGASGSGKSTLCQLITGELEPTSGTVWGGPERAPCGYLTADVESQLLGSTVAQELEMGRFAGPADAYGQPPNETLERARETLVARFQGREQEDPQNISVGEQQLLLLTSLALGPFSLLILDEGLSSLDQASFVAVCTALRELARGGSLILVVSHEIRLLPWVDRCLGLSQGRVVFDVSSAELTWDQLWQVKLWLGALVCADRTEPVLQPVQPVAVAAKPLSARQPERPRPLLEFDSTPYNLGDGQVLALAGISGSGKSRLLATLAGLDRLVGWQKGGGEDGYVVLLPQKARGVLWHRHVGAELEASLAEGRRRKGTTAITDLNEIPAAWMPRSGRSLSQGESKLVACLCLILQQPDLLLLDEPFSGLDANLRAHLERRLGDFLGRGGRLVFSTHHPDEMILYPNRLLVLDHGAPLWYGSGSDYFAGSPNPHLGRPGLPTND